MSWKLLDLITAWLLIAAGLHVGLATMDIDLVGQAQLNDLMRKGLFALMGVAALYQFALWRRIRRRIKN